MSIEFALSEFHYKFVIFEFNYAFYTINCDQINKLTNTQLILDWNLIIFHLNFGHNRV